MNSSWYLLMQGMVTTLTLWLSASCISLTVGMIVGCCVCDKLWLGKFSTTLSFGAFILRAVPFYVQLLIVYFALPMVTGFSLSSMCAAILTLGICSGAYSSQTIKGGINALPSSQWEAAYLLGYSRLETVRFIILPQVLRTITPMLISEFDQLLKSTSIAATIGILELTRVGMNIVSREMNPMSTYGSVALVYIFISSALFIFGQWITRKVAYANS